jgi:hypothetical protein
LKELNFSPINFKSCDCTNYIFFEGKKNSFKTLEGKLNNLILKDGEVCPLCFSKEKIDIFYYPLVKYFQILFANDNLWIKNFKDSINDDFNGTEIKRITNYFEKKENKTIYIGSLISLILGNLYDGLQLCKETSLEIFPCMSMVLNLNKGNNLNR